MTAGVEYMHTGNKLFIVISVSFAIFGLLRNEWVYRKRLKVLRCMDSHYYNNLPSYHFMFIKFWVWDINLFFK